jgi:hypothetical protein
MRIPGQEDRADVGAHGRREHRALVTGSEGLDITRIVSRGRSAVYSPTVLRLRGQQYRDDRPRSSARLETRRAASMGVWHVVGRAGVLPSKRIERTPEATIVP